MELCKCGSDTVIYREGKQVCLNCLVQKIVREEESNERL
jgi:hypothetical protein